MENDVKKLIEVIDAMKNRLNCLCTDHRLSTEEAEAIDEMGIAARALSDAAEYAVEYFG